MDLGGKEKGKLFQMVVVARLIRRRASDHGQCGTSIITLAAHAPSPSSTSLFPSSTKAIRHSRINHPYHSQYPSSPLLNQIRPNPSKCLPKLLRRNPPLAVRLPQAKLPPKRRKQARRPPPPLVRRRSATRRERRPTPHTSTKVCFSSMWVPSRVVSGWSGQVLYLTHTFRLIQVLGPC